MKPIHIKNFSQFKEIYGLLESQDTDTRLVDFFSSLTRNYTTERPFYTDNLQFIIEEEKRDWSSTIDKVELEKKITIEANYRLKFISDEKKYILSIKFDFIIEGHKEKDAPEAMSQENQERLSISLEHIDIKHITAKSSSIDYDSSEISQPIRRACEDFIIKMLENDYDMPGGEIYKLEQK
jgi:hypothetical protein